MSKLSRRSKVFVLTGVAALIILLYFSSLFVQIQENICAKDEYTGQKECAAYHIGPFILLYVFETIETYNGTVTAVATAFIGWFTLTIYRVNRSQLIHARQVERAYVSGGVVIEFEPVTTDLSMEAGTLLADDGVIRPRSRWPRRPPRPRWLVVTVDNHGKTPAFISDIAVASCALNELPPVPEYTSARRFAGLRVSPGTIGLRTQFRFEFQNVGGKLIYGRVFYSDIFRGEHSSGFVLHVLSSTIGAFEAPPEYIAWD